MMDICELVAAHYGWIRKTAARFFRDRCDAEDLAGETICKLLTNGERFDRAREFKPWAYAIMANTFRTLYNRRRCVLFTGYDHENEAYGSPEATDQLAAVSCLLSVISECGRRSLCIECVLLYAEGYNYAEIARLSGIPIGTVRSRISSGRRMLRAALEQGVLFS